MGLFSFVGDFVNDALGGSSSAKKQQTYNAWNQARQFKYDKELGAINQKYALESMAKQFAYEKQAAQSAHQWEIADLEKAGLNPILSAGGSGASADVGLTSGSTGGSGLPGAIGSANGNIMDLINAVGSASKLSAELGLLKSQQNKTDAETKNTDMDTGIKAIEKTNADPKIKSEIKKNLAEAAASSARGAKDIAETTKTKADPRYLGGKVIEDAEKEAKKPQNKKDKDEGWSKGPFGIQYRKRG